MFERPYGAASSILVVLPKVGDTDLADTGDYSYTSGDFMVTRDGGTAAALAGTPTEIDMGAFMFVSVPLSATELQCAQLGIALADAALEHNAWVVETYGHPLAQHPSRGLAIPSGQLSGTHTTTSADLGTNAPAAISNGSLVWNLTKGQGRFVSGYASGVVSWADALGSAWEDDDDWYLFPGGPGASLDAAAVRSAIGLAAANLDTQLATIDTNVDDIETAAGVIAAAIEAIDLLIDAIKERTDNLPDAPAAVSNVPTAVQNADALLGRNINGGSSSGRTVKQALKRLRNKVSISGSTMTVTDEDDTTASWTAAVSTSASQEPITGVDPS